MVYAIGKYKFNSEAIIDEVITQWEKWGSKNAADQKSASNYFMKNWPAIIYNYKDLYAAALQLKTEIKQKRIAEQQAEEVKKIQDQAPVEQVEVVEKLSNDKTKMYLMVGGITILLGIGVYVATKN